MWRRQLSEVVEVQEDTSTLDGDQSIDEIAGSVWGSTGWYLVVLGQYNLVLLGIKWYWVSIGLLCLYMSQLLLLGKFEYTGGPIFKVVLEC